MATSLPMALEAVHALLDDVVRAVGSTPPAADSRTRAVLSGRAVLAYAHPLGVDVAGLRRRAAAALGDMRALRVAFQAEMTSEREALAAQNPAMAKADAKAAAYHEVTSQRTYRARYRGCARRGSTAGTDLAGAALISQRSRS